MGRRLAENVVLRDPELGVPVVFAAGDTPPGWAQDAITNPDVWADGPGVGATGAADDTPPGDDTGSDDDTDGSDETSSERPAQNAAKAVWEAYADSLGLDTDGMTKADIVAAVDALDS